MLRNVSLYGFAKIGPAAINFFAIALYARLLGPAEYGRYALVIGGVSLAVVIGFAWLRMSLIRLLPAYLDRQEVFLSTLLRGYALAAAASVAVAIVVWAAIPDATVRSLVPIGLLLVWAQGAFELNLDLSVSRLEPITYGRITLARSGLGVGTAFVLAKVGLGVTGVLVGTMVGLLIPLFFTGRRNWADTALSKSNPTILADVTSYSFPLVATLMLEFVVNASDRFFLGWLKGPAAAGAYAVGYDLSQQSLTVLLVTVNLAAWPAVLLALEEGGREAAVPRLAEQGGLLACIGFPAAAGLASLAGNVAHVFLGVAFEHEAAQLIPLIALATLIGGAKSYYFDLSFQFGKATRNQIWIMLAAAGTNVGCNIGWIPVHGAMGAAWATIAAYVVGLLLSWWRGRAVFPIPLPWREWTRIAVATGVMVFALEPLRDARGPGMLLIQFLAGLGSYSLAALLLDLVGIRGRVSRLGQGLRTRGA